MCQDLTCLINIKFLNQQLDIAHGLHFILINTVTIQDITKCSGPGFLLQLL